MEKKTCVNYNAIRKKIIEQRQTTWIYYALMDQLKMINKIITFFMALTRKTTTNTFNSKYTFKSLFIFSNRRNLRNLEETTSSEGEVTCNLNNSLIVDLTARYNCQSNQIIIKEHQYHSR